ncbi:hypothetical protein AV530_001743 [Patagioenas fasciata monilis]|uniref:Uncharacterized protein n=1 Tax=Patagioenas fasciata monilis TaxID=372326 RepID=A0A1V4KM32_PATFA|nr:hypothetical protein AV530_001743 [Patagioenas fasciata monilis]
MGETSDPQHRRFNPFLLPATTTAHINKLCVPEPVQSISKIRSSKATQQPWAADGLITLLATTILAPLDISVLSSSLKANLLAGFVR